MLCVIQLMSYDHITSYVTCICVLDIGKPSVVCLVSCVLCLVSGVLSLVMYPASCRVSRLVLCLLCPMSCLPSPSAYVLRAPFCTLCDESCVLFAIRHLSRVICHHWLVVTGPEHSGTARHGRYGLGRDGTGQRVAASSIRDRPSAAGQ